MSSNVKSFDIKEEILTIKKEAQAERFFEKRLVILTGGWSSERDIALLSGKNCQAELLNAGFTCVDLLDIAEEGALQKLRTKAYDLAFIALHGKYGEDGKIQGFLDILRIPYTFSGVLASALSADKQKSKEVYRANKLRTPKSVFIANKHAVEASREALESLNYPVFVKPVDNGSSIGVTRVAEPSQMSAALEEVFKLGTSALVEEGVSGVEASCVVIGDKHPQALTPIGIKFRGEFYNQEEKYESPELHHLIPAPLSKDALDEVKNLALAAHLSLGCSGASRSDFMVDGETAYLLETNNIPGMTENSLLTDLARHEGILVKDLFLALAWWALHKSE